MKIWSLPLKKGRWTWRIWRTRRTASHSERFWQDPLALCPFGQSEGSEYCNGWTKGNSSVRSQTISNADSSLFSIHINREKIAKQRKFKKPDGVMVHNWVHSSLWWWCRRPRSRRRTTSQAGFWLVGKAAMSVFWMMEMLLVSSGLSGWFTKAMTSCFRKKNRRPRSKGGETWLQGQKVSPTRWTGKKVLGCTFWSF